MNSPKQKTTSQNFEKTWTYRELSEFLGMSQGALRVWVMQKKIPYFKCGKKLVRFSPSAIERWLSEHSVAAGGSK